MASTYTNRLGLEKQGDGDNPNSWGSILNTNVIDLIDDAIAGYEIVSVSSTGITLSDNTGAVDQSRNASLEFAGTLTANVTITIPSEEKTYFIRENTTGSFAVQVKTISGSAITLTQQNNSLISCDGTNIYSVDPPTSVATFTANTFTATSITTSTITVSGNVSATEFYGGGANLTGISGLPTGAVVPFAGASAPSNHLLCFGQAISRSTYSDLFTAIGGGAETHTLTVAQLAAHTHGSFTQVNAVAGNTADGTGGPSANLNTSSTGGGAAHNNVQPTIILNYIIKT